MQDSAIETYLTEVLGLRTLLTPATYRAEKLSPAEALPAVIENLFFVQGEEPQVLLWIKKTPNEVESQLLLRMMKAAKITQYLVFWGSSLKQLPQVYFEAGLQHGIKFFGAPDYKDEVFANLLLIHTSTLDSMLEGPAHEIQTHKKKVWGHIQDIQQLLPAK